MVPKIISLARKNQALSENLITSRGTLFLVLGWQVVELGYTFCQKGKMPLGVANPSFIPV